MQPEIEIKFTKINKQEIRDKLTLLNATLEQPERLMRRKTFDFIDIKLNPGEHKWMRIRDECNKITMTLKHLIDKNAIDGVKEVELVVDNFEEANSLLLAMGLVETNSQENYRETWELDGVEITIDAWPGLQPFVEIEGQSENEVKAVAAKLGFDFSKAIMGSVDYVYEQELNVPASELQNVKQLSFADWQEQLQAYL